MKTSSRPSAELKNRVVSAIVLAVAVLALVWVGGDVVRLLAAVFAGIIFYEWVTIRRIRTRSGHLWLASLCLAVVLCLLVADFPAHVLFGCLALAVVAVGAHGAVSGEGAWSAAGLAYAAASGITLALLRGDDRDGLLVIFYLFSIVWATDIVAFFAGRSLGGPKLAPAISPSKTWSGAVGGAVGGLCAGQFFAMAAGWHGWRFAAVALILAVVSQLGDLLESSLKRRQGVKDSGRLIPGHGGLMDRADGLVAAAWALYVIGAFLGGAETPASGLVSG